jgi:light-regulated signal transduction histidine kinase (bacteriophytochrome)
LSNPEEVLRMPGFLQSYGVLLVVDEKSELRVIGCSENSETLLKKPANQVLPRRHRKLSLSAVD